MTDPTNRTAWEWAATILEEESTYGGELQWIRDGQRCYRSRGDDGDVLTIVNADDTVTRREVAGDVEALT